MGAGTHLPTEGTVFLSVKNDDKTDVIVEAAQTVSGLGFKIVATAGTASFLQEQGIACDTIKKVYEGRPNIVDLMKDGGVQLVMNTTRRRGGGVRTVAKSARSPCTTRSRISPRQRVPTQPPWR